MDNLFYYIMIGQWVLIGLIIVFYSLLGFKRGVGRSLYYTIVKGSLLLLPFLLAAMFPLTLFFKTSQEFFSFFAKFGIDLSMVSDYVGDEYSYAVLIAQVQVVFNLVLFIVNAILIKPLLFLLIFKPIYNRVLTNTRKQKKIKKKYYKAGYKYPIKKPNPVSRLGGMVIGMATGFLILVFMLSPLIVISGAVSDKNIVTNVSLETNDPHLRLSNYHSNLNTNNQLSEFKEYVDGVRDFNTKGLGLITKQIRITDRSIDEYVFDLFFSSNIKLPDNESYQIRASKEINIIGGIASAVYDYGLEYGLETTSITYENSYESIDYVLTNISKSDLLKTGLKVSVNLLDDLLNTEELIGFKLSENEYTKDIVTEFRDLDIEKEFKTISNIAKEVLKLGDLNEVLNSIKTLEGFANADIEIKEGIINALNHITELKLLYAANVGFEILANNQSVLNTFSYIDEAERYAYLHDRLDFIFEDHAFLQKELKSLVNTLSVLFREEHQNYDYNKIIVNNKFNALGLLEQDSMDIVVDMGRELGKLQIINKGLPLALELVREKNLLGNIVVIPTETTSDDLINDFNFIKDLGIDLVNTLNSEELLTSDLKDIDLGTLILKSNFAENIKFDTTKNKKSIFLYTMFKLFMDSKIDLGGAPLEMPIEFDGITYQDEIWINEVNNITGNLVLIIKGLVSDENYKLTLNTLPDFGSADKLINNLMSNLTNEDLDEFFSSLILHNLVDNVLKRQIGDLTIPVSSLDSKGRISKAEIISLLEAFRIVGDFSEITVDNLVDVIDLDSKILNLLVTSQINSFVEIPEESYIEGESIVKKEELINLIEVIKLFGVSGEDTVDKINTDNLTVSINILDQILTDFEDSPIIMRLVSNFVIQGFGDSLSESVYVDENKLDIKYDELVALKDALMHLGVDSDLTELDPSTITITTLNNMLLENSTILRGIVSSSILTIDIDLPSSVIDSEGLITQEELDSLFAGLNAAGIENLSNMQQSVDSLTITKVKDMMLEDSEIIRSLVSETLISSLKDSVPESVIDGEGIIEKDEIIKLLDALLAGGIDELNAIQTQVDALSVQNIIDMRTKNSVIFELLLSNTIKETLTVDPNDLDENGNVKSADITLLLSDVSKIPGYNLSDSIVVIPAVLAGLDGPQQTELTLKISSGQITSKILKDTVVTYISGLPGI